MESEKIVPTEQELKGFDLNDPTIIELIHRAQEGDAADRLLTIREALAKYRKAVFWALLLSTSLIMEGYDLVIVCIAFHLARGDTVQNIHADILSTDQLFFWPNAISNPIWGIRPRSRPQYNHSFVAVRAIQLICRWPAVRPADQCLCTRPIRLSADHDGFYGMDGSRDFHSILLTLLGSSVIWRGYVWYSVGRFSGMPQNKPSAIQYHS
jgi:hypothetical protein